jgi:hypothetical protein
LMFAMALIAFIYHVWLLFYDCLNLMYDLWSCMSLLEYALSC